MEKENIIIESKSNGKIPLIMCLTIVIALLMAGNMASKYKESIKLEEAHQNVGEALGYINHYESANSSYEKASEYKSKAVMQMCGLIVSIMVIIISVILILYSARTKFVITDKRISGVAAFGKRIDIPIDSISTIGTGFLQSVVVASSSGKIFFAGLSNQKDIYATVSNLLIDRQESKNHHDKAIQNMRQKNDITDDFKKLLDSGIITQEEFEARKNNS